MCCNVKVRLTCQTMRKVLQEHSHVNLLTHCLWLRLPLAEQRGNTTEAVPLQVEDICHLVCSTEFADHGSNTTVARSSCLALSVREPWEGRREVRSG
jgi:hypothetical protein